MLAVMSATAGSVLHPLRTVRTGYLRCESREPMVMSSMRQRLWLSAATLGDPAVLVLDGRSRDSIRGRPLAARVPAAGSGEGRTVLVSSRALGEVERTADSIAAGVRTREARRAAHAARRGDQPAAEDEHRLRAALQEAARLQSERRACSHRVPRARRGHRSEVRVVLHAGPTGQRTPANAVRAMPRRRKQIQGVVHMSLVAAAANVVVRDPSGRQVVHGAGRTIERIVSDHRGDGQPGGDLLERPELLSASGSHPFLASSFCNWVDEALADPA